MRWIVYALLLVNLGLLAWNLHTGPTPAATRAAPVPAPDGEEAQRLPLLAELDRETLRTRRAEAPPPEAAPASPLSVPAPASPSPAPVVAAVSTTTSSTSDVMPTPGTEPSSPAAPSPGDGATTDPEAEPATRAAADPTPLPAPREVAAAPRACMTLGPLDASAPIAEMRSWLEARNATVDVRNDQRREVALYWVFFPPRASREVAVEEVARMKSQGIEDIIVVPKGDMANAISLGVFSRTESRDRRLAELGAKGYNPSIGPRYRSKVASWVDVAADEGALTVEAVEARWPGVRVTATPCAGVAPAPAPPPTAGTAGEGTAVGASETADAGTTSEGRRYFFSGQAR